jgi:zinc transport system substrate-binding protein
MKKILCILLTAALVLSLAACSQNNKSENEKEKAETLKIVCTIFPEYDWVKNIVGADNPDVELSFLLDSGVDLHSFQPTVDDIVKISQCDLFIYVGGESDGWVEDALASANRSDITAVNLMEVLGSSVKTEETVEGMQAEEAEEAEEEEEEKDEHVWLSLRNAAAICAELKAKLCEIDPANADKYAANADSYIAKLNALDKEYTAAVSGAKQKVLLFGDRFPFRYMTDDYGLKYYAAFVGCSAETEASFETISFLAGKVDENKLTTVLTIEGGDGSIAGTIVQNTKDKNQQILALDSMQSTTLQDVQNGAGYLDIMEKNLGVLEKALG